MLGSSAKIVPALIFAVIFIFTFFTFNRTPSLRNATSKDTSAQSSTPLSSTALAIEDTKSLADQNEFFDATLEGGARIRQACMLFRNNDDHGRMGANVVYERSVRTHLKHAEKWGYPSHILREDIIGQGVWDVLVLSSPEFAILIGSRKLTKNI